MQTEDILQIMTFNNAEEKAEALKYINLKGIVLYKRAIDFCIYEGKEKPSYKEVSSLYRYDKRLRDTLYKYIAAAEEYIRAVIGNTYEDNHTGLIFTTKLTEKLKKYNSLSLALEQLMISELKDVVLQNQAIFKDNIVINANLEINLKALKILRNKIGHHNFLLAEDYGKCFVDGKEYETLEANLKNLQQFLPLEFRKGFATSIRNCSKGLSISEKFNIDIEPLIISKDKIEKLSQQIINIIKKDDNDFADYIDSVNLAIYDEEWKNAQETLYYKAINTYHLDLEWAGRNTEECLLNLYRICCPQFNLMFDIECGSQKKVTKPSFKAAVYKFTRKYEIFSSAIVGLFLVLLLLMMSFEAYKQDSNSWTTNLFMGLASSILAATIIMTINKWKRSKARKTEVIADRVTYETNQFFKNLNETYKCFNKSKENAEDSDFALHYVDIDNLINNYCIRMCKYGLQECSAFNQLKLLEKEIFKETKTIVRNKGQFINGRGFVITIDAQDTAKATEQMLKLKQIVDELKWQIQDYIYSLSKEQIRLEDTLL